MRILGVVGGVLTVLGWLMLAAPGPARWLFRVAGATPLPAHEAGRVGTWGLLILGVVVVVLARVV